MLYLDLAARSAACPNPNPIPSCSTRPARAGRDVLYLDLALEGAVRAALEGGLTLRGDEDAGAAGRNSGDLAAPLAPLLAALENACLSLGSNCELVLCLKDFQARSSPIPNPSSLDTRCRQPLVCCMEEPALRMRARCVWRPRGACRMSLSMPPAPAPESPGPAPPCCGRPRRCPPRLGRARRHCLPSWRVTACPPGVTACPPGVTACPPRARPAGGCRGAAPPRGRDARRGRRRAPGPRAGRALRALRCRAAASRRRAGRRARPAGRTDRHLL